MVIRCNCKLNSEINEFPIKSEIPTFMKYLILKNVVISNRTGQSLLYNLIHTNFCIKTGIQLHLEVTSSLFIVNSWHFKEDFYSKNEVINQSRKIPGYIYYKGNLHNSHSLCVFLVLWNRNNWQRILINYPAKYKRLMQTRVCLWVFIWYLAKPFELYSRGFSLT